ncbi:MULTISPECIES: dTDP-4-dehydrorhamnose reductase [Pseudanabaena]|uniref:dTDP-4-dehydrorhamnose reductase n=2 Tax=Pseudanabaena TaxID=1152 RepID=L8MRS4_9CYAN|nr:MULTISPECIES: dTDP-4-dehydrorhamnose reductase [Pseudanabaena]ELS30612.1 dTDP-4-dehydrorhamnose reductase [Pseudanabaena biceps PCC 7429]MDG3497121.1 dTDP-4-dehydrorhamnose reductase [Pseudanabaena catenata USMAC16]
MSNPLKVALIGANGQLGSDIVSHFAQGDRYQLTALTRTDIDICDANAVDRVLSGRKFDVVINSAAYVRVDDCEQEVERAFNVNAIGALNVARASRDIGALCVYVSTDYVFHGDRQVPYTESDLPDPINVYGTSKLTGEYLVKQTTLRSLILRISSVFGKAGASGKGGNFVETIIKKAKAGDSLKVVDDMFMSPTYTYDVARLLDELLQAGTTGIMHGANAGICSWHELATEILRLANIDHPIESIPTSAFPTKAKRPMNSALVSDRLNPSAAFKMRSWQDALTAYLSEKSYL